MHGCSARERSRNPFKYGDIECLTWFKFLEKCGG